MPEPLYTSDPAKYVTLERLYVTELPPPGAVRGADLSRGIVGGATVRGPVDTPVDIASFSRFLDVFGGRDLTANGTGGALVNEVWEFFLAKPFGIVTVVRAAAAAAVKASFNLETDEDGTTGTEVLKVEASSPGSWAGSAAGGSSTGVKVKVEAATDGDSNHFNLRVNYLGQTKLYENLDISSTNDNTLTVLGDDYANWITLTKLAAGVPVTTGMAGLDSDGYVTLGQTVANFTSVAGSDGSIADSDYTGTGRVIDILAAYKGVSWACVAKRANSTINAAIKAKAAVASDRMFLIWNGTLGASSSTVITDAANYRSDRVVYCFNSPYVVDTQTAQQIQVPPHSFMASIFSQTAPEQHVGSQRTKAWLAGITKLTHTGLQGGDYELLRAAGISALERAADGNHIFVSGRTTDLTDGRREIARRRQADFIQLSLAYSSEPFVKEENTELARAELAGLYTSFLDDLKQTPRIVERFSIEQDSVNTDAQRAQGIEAIQVNVRLIGHILGLVVRTNIGTGVVVTEASV